MKTKDLPKPLQPYACHGLQINYEGDEETATDCVFCSAEEKLNVNSKTGKWRCLVCDANGNEYTFIRNLWDISHKNTTESDYAEIANARDLTAATLESWGVAKSIINGRWLVPAYNTENKIVNLYRYVKIKNKYRLLATNEMGHGIFGIQRYNNKKKVVYLTEGPWDGMKLWQTLGSLKEKGNRIVKINGTTKLEKTLLGGANVLSVPGCTTFNKSWSDVFKGKTVYVVYDNDHPRTNKVTKQKIEPPAIVGTKRVSSVLPPSADISYLRWGQNGKDYDRDLDDGYDVSDKIKDTSETKAINFISNNLEPVPEEWRESTSIESEKRRHQCIECNSWEELIEQWKKALKWTDGLDLTLSAMLASIVSTEFSGDQLWLKIYGPPSCGKSTLCYAVSVATQYVLAKSSIRGFHSGFKQEKGNTDEDNSLIAEAMDKTLVTKDGDTLLQSPNLGQILSEARDIYDRTSSTHYRNAMGKKYENVNMTWILCGTASLRVLDDSELGARFLDCVVMDEIDDEAEDDILMMVAERENKNLSRGEEEETSSEDPELKKACEMTGGYICYLKENAAKLLQSVRVEKTEIHKITRIGKFVAFMRARPSKRQEEQAEREFAARLVSQHLRLAKFLAVVLDKTKLDEDVMSRVFDIGFHTARGVVLDMCSLMNESGDLGLQVKTLSLKTNQSEDRVRSLLRFLKSIGAVEAGSKLRVGKSKPQKQWRLTETLTRLMEEVE